MGAWPGVRKRATSVRIRSSSPTLGANCVRPRASPGVPTSRTNPCESEEEPVGVEKRGKGRRRERMEARQNPDQASNFYCCGSCIYTLQRKGGGIQNEGSTWLIIIGAACAGFHFRRELLSHKSGREAGCRPSSNGENFLAPNISSLFISFKEVGINRVRE